MKFVIAPDKFKGSLTGFEFCDAVEEGLLMVFNDAKILKKPLADGGDSTIEVVNYYLNGNNIEVEVNNPVFNKIKANYLYAEESKTAFIEMAEASGLKLLKPEEQNCMNTTTFGTGQLILDAINKGAKHIILGIGGSDDELTGFTPARPGPVGWGVRGHDLEDGSVGSIPGIVALPEDLGEFGDRGDEAETIGGVFQPASQHPGGQVIIEFFESPGRLIPVAQVEAAEASNRPGPLDLVDCGHGGARAYLARVNLVVAEIHIGDITFFITKQTVVADDCRVEVDLDFRVAGEELQLVRQAEEVPPALAGVNVLVPAVALIGEALEHPVALDRLAAPGSESVGEEGDQVALGESPDSLEDGLGPLGTEVGYAIGTEKHAVGRPVVVALSRQPVGQIDSRLDIGSSIWREAVDGCLDVSALASRGVGQDDEGVGGEGDDRHPVVGAEVSDQRLEALLEQFQLALGGHRSRGVDGKGQDGVFSLRGQEVSALDGDLQEL